MNNKKIEDENTQKDVQVAAITSFIELVLVAFLLFYIRHKKTCILYKKIKVH